MKTNNKKNCKKPSKKRIRKKYAYALKRKVVHEIKMGIISREEAMYRYGIKSRQAINCWMAKYSSLSYYEQKDYGMKQSPEERNKELLAKIEELQAAIMVLNTAIDISDEENGTNIRKKFLPQQLIGSKKLRKKKNSSSSSLDEEKK